MELHRDVGRRRQGDVPCQVEFDQFRATTPLQLRERTPSTHWEFEAAALRSRRSPGARSTADLLHLERARGEAALGGHAPGSGLEGAFAPRAPRPHLGPHTAGTYGRTCMQQRQRPSTGASIDVCVYVCCGVACPREAANFLRSIWKLPLRSRSEPSGRKYALAPIDRWRTAGELTHS